MDKKKLIDAAANRILADLVFKNGRIVNVFTHEIIEADLAVHRGVIVGMGSYKGQTEVDLTGRFLLPGFIDSHVHLESAMVTPEEYARMTLPRGTTGVIADPHEISNVLGIEGVEYFLKASEHTAQDVYIMAPSCVPATPFEHNGARLDAGAIEELLKRDRIIGLGEMMDYPGVAAAREDVLAKLDSAFRAGKPVDGHGPLLRGNDLNAYVSAGIATDHECSTPQEMKEKLRLGMRILIREGTAARNLIDLLPALDVYSSRRCSFCTDDKQTEDILENGHMDHILRKAVAQGLDPLTAVQMVSINAAETYGLSGKGAAAPGYDADLVICDNLSDFTVLQVYKKGVLVSEKGEMVLSVKKSDTSSVTGSVRTGPLSREDFRIRLESNRVHVIKIRPGSLVTDKAVREVLRDGSGYYRNDYARDIRKIAVIERHRGTGSVGLGLVEGFGIRNGALAMTVAHDSHNLIIVGDNDEDMFTAFKELSRTGGGITLSGDGQILETLPLPVAGLMSDQSGEYVRDKLIKLKELAYDRLMVNGDLDPFVPLSFMALPVIPSLKITDRGLFDGDLFEFIPLEAD